MASISRQFIDRIKEEADLVAIIDQYLSQPLKKAGSVYKARSPFTKERTASFTVSPTKGIWKDFSSGKGGNNAISFVMAKTGCSYPEAIHEIARKMNLEVEYDDSKAAKQYMEKQQKKENLRPLLQSTINKYHKLFLELPAYHPAKVEVYHNRQYTDQIVKDYKIGFAPEAKKTIYNLCVEVGRKEDAKEIGLITDYGDRFRNRVIYPIFQDKAGYKYPVGMAGRDLSNEPKAAKWINSSESVLYTKSKVLYGLDVALPEIVKKKEVWLVEGYNDCIAWQINGIKNTVAPCGTAITEAQIKFLRRHCDRVVLLLDPDKAGIKSMLENTPLFLEAGFRTEVVLLPDYDPDDFVRAYKKSIDKYGLKEFDTDQDLRQDGFKLLLQHKILGKKGVTLSKNTKELCQTIANIPDDFIQTTYSKWLAEESKITITQINKWIKAFTEETQKEVLSEQAKRSLSAKCLYELPKQVKEPLDELLPTIEKYQMFVASNQIWMQSNFDEPPFKFKSVSNFSIEIIQHMQDEEFPMKLIRIKNIHNHEKIFDIPSEVINTPQKFEDAVTAHGNYFWKGGRNEHQKLKAYLFDKMGTGRKVSILGWQPEGFWCWNNQVTVPGQDSIQIDKNGVFIKDKVSYYVPAANQIYKDNVFKYQPQKKVIVKQSELNFNDYSTQVIKVHRNHGITALLFSIASMFQDIVAEHTAGSFPMLFFYGPASSGKDQLAAICQSFFGIPQTALNLEGDASTIKAKIIEFAQFMNMICHLSEYKPDIPKLDGILKALWDRIGYKRGNIKEKFGQDIVPILSSVIMTGNYTPESEALITRLVYEEMSKAVFTDEEVKEYDKLSDMTKQGISHFTVEILQHREMVSLNFKRVYRALKETYIARFPEAKSRMITNISVLTAFYDMFKDVLQFPFNMLDITNHFEKGIEAQIRKLTSASIINRWWDCFLASMRGTLADQLRVGHDFKLEGNRLYFQFTNCYNKIQRQWWSQYHDTAPGKSVMMDAIRKDQSYIEDIKSVRMAAGRDAKSTSACVVELNALPITDELKFAVEFQLNENSLFDKPPATPDNTIDEDDSDGLF